MAKTNRDRLAERARSRRAVAELHGSPDAGRVRTLLAGGSPCESCGAYAVRWSSRDDARRCSECGAVQPRPAA